MATVVANGTYYGRALLVRQSAGLTMAETSYDADVCVPQHVHETAMFSLVLEGGLEERSERECALCAPGGLLFVPAGAAHGHRFLARRSRAFTVQVGDDWAARFEATDVRMPTWPMVVPRGGGAWNAARLYGEFRAGIAESLALDECAVATLGALAQWPRPRCASENRARWLATASDYVRAHFRESFSLSELSRLTGVHPAYLSRAFRQRTGETLSDLMRRLRIEHAADRLVRDSVPVGLIGLEAGFADHSHFTRAFKRATGTTPQAYRALFSPRRAGPDPRAAPSA